MFEVSILATAEAVEQAGGDAAPLRALVDEATALERPPGALAGLLAGVREAAARQWARVLGELAESRDAATLVAAAVTGERALSPAERDRVRAQLADLVKMVPAGLIAAAGAVAPLPGTAMVTPWLLEKLGLMPSRWREAHLLEQVRRQEAALRAEGRGAAADRVLALRTALADEAELRAGVPAPERGLDEIVVRADLARLREVAAVDGHLRAWFVSFAGQIYGPCRLTEIDAGMDPLLVCWRGEGRWVFLRELLTPS